MPKSDTLNIRDSIDRAREVRDAYAALTDLALDEAARNCDRLDDRQASQARHASNRG
ncbi:hypothetical protein [Salinisphaera orenii]|uniref:Uncharacterized protein n=1 Tax=Salinisphaera orenii YIM 95161 TaxID=1051139 RepID=A0A423PRS2_9GAMM|nr:hypothetical protein [Salinisphaera halophila]ROO28278.1 hypothetical protein SAHL_10820 [Salinisphaera halophila YIM 95161]